MSINWQILILIWLAIANFLILPTSQARYLNIETGRFITMDTDEGDNEDTLSLHKYLYAADDPVNLDDPSGNASMLSMILAPLASELYAGTSGQALNFISSLGVFAPAESVDVYLWDAKFPLVGHCMITKHNSQVVILSQFPFKDRGKTGGVNLFL